MSDSPSPHVTFKHDPIFFSRLLDKANLYKTKVYKEGACLEENAQKYFYDDRLQEKAISLYCNSCSVKAECLQWALITSEDELVWGGTTDSERRRIIKAVRTELKESYNEMYAFPLPTNLELWNMLLNKFTHHIPSLKNNLEK